MPPNTSPDVGDAVAAPLGDMIAHIGRGVAEAQEALDAQTFRTFKKMFRADDEVGNEMRRLGFTPTWYRIPEAEAELRISLTMATHGEATGAPSASGGSDPGPSAPVKMYAAPIDANYANKYDFKVEAVSQVKFKIVAVPASTQSESARIVPEGLERKKFGQVKKLLDEWEIKYVLTGRKAKRPESLTVASVTPKPGTALSPDEKVTVELK